jgi:hypothetical protein
VRITPILSIVLTISFVSSAVIAQSKAADADAKKRAKTLYRSGMRLAREGDCENAILEFKASVAAFPNKGSLYNLATCYNTLSQDLEAISAFNRLFEAFDKELSVDMRESASSQLAELKARFAWVQIAVDQSGAEIAIDGNPKGESPVDSPLPLSKESHEIIVSLKGFEPWQQRLDLTNGGERTVTVTLQPEKGELALTIRLKKGGVTLDAEEIGQAPLNKSFKLPPGEHRVVVKSEAAKPIERVVTIQSGEQAALLIEEEVEPAEVAAVGRPLPSSGPSHSSKQRIMRISGFTAMGVGAASLIAGAITGSMALGLDDELSKKCPKGECPKDVDFKSDEQKMNTLGISSTALIVTGAVAAAAGATFTILSYRQHPGESRRLAFSPVITSNEMGAHIQIRF